MPQVWPDGGSKMDTSVALHMTGRPASMVDTRPPIQYVKGLEREESVDVESKGYGGMGWDGVDRE